MTPSRIFAVSASILLLLALAACSSTKITTPARSATEEMIIASAADRAADNLALALPTDSTVFIDSSYVDVTGDAKYAIASIRAAIGRHGNRIIADRSKAKTVIEIRASALSVDDRQFLIGIPAFTLPLPLTGNLSLPELALYAKHEKQGVAAFAATGFDAQSGAVIATSPNRYGYSHHDESVVMFLFSWTSQDYLDQKDADTKSAL